MTFHYSIKDGSMFVSFELMMAVIIAAAVLPAIVLLVYIYRHDRLEAESPKLLRTLVFMGILSTAFAMVAETVGEAVLSQAGVTGRAYNFILFFLIVAGAEEGSKYLLLKKKTWKNPEFNCQFDGVVYATFVSLGFALWENISYVMTLGLGTAVLRAVTAVPGHACFGVYMGAFYGIAKRFERVGDKASSKFYRALSLLAPVVLHGTYDYIATEGSTFFTILFFAFIILLFSTALKLVKRMSREDIYI